MCCAAGTLAGLGEEGSGVRARRPFLEMRGELAHHNPSILYFSSISIVQQARPPPLQSDID